MLQLLVHSRVAEKIVGQGGECAGGGLAPGDADDGLANLHVKTSCFRVHEKSSVDDHLVLGQVVVLGLLQYVVNEVFAVRLFGVVYSPGLRGDQHDCRVSLSAKASTYRITFSLLYAR